MHVEQDRRLKVTRGTEMSKYNYSRCVGRVAVCLLSCGDWAITNRASGGGGYDAGYGTRNKLPVFACGDPAPTST
jgi:hypothetical protein